MFLGVRPLHCQPMVTGLVRVPSASHQGLRRRAEQAQHGADVPMALRNPDGGFEVPAKGR